MRAGVQVEMVTRDHDLEFGGRQGAAEEFLDRATSSSVGHEVIRGRVRSPRGWADAVRVRHAVGRFAPGVVHLQAWAANDVRLPFACGARRHRFALTIHDPVRHPGEEVGWGVLLRNRALVRSAGLIFVHAAALRDELIEVERPRAPVVVVPHGVESGAWEPFPDQPSILFFGRIRRYKGIDVLLEAMSRVWSRVPDATLVIAGEGELEEHPSLADPRVTLRAEHIPDEEVSSLLSAASCVALPYRQASQSGVGSLAKRHGRPLVVTSLGGLPELVADGSGLAVPPEDPAALADALCAVLEDRALAERLGRAGARTAEGGADWDTVAALTVEAYEEHLVPWG